MPGSLINLYNNNCSDSSNLLSRSADYRTPGKKVSFNKAVRIKQYPDDDPDNRSHVVLPSQRFWFKVYKSNPSAHHNIAWSEDNDKTSCVPDYKEEIYDALTPIAEDEDVVLEKLITSQRNRNSTLPSNQTTFRNGFSRERHFLDPPIDYIDNEYPLRSSLSPSEKIEPCDAKVALPSYRKDENSVNDTKDLHEKKYDNLNGDAWQYRSNLMRPTVSSAAKSVVENIKNKPKPKQQINVKLPRMVENARLTDTDTNNNENTLLHSKSKQRVRSMPNNNRGQDDERNGYFSRVDKAVSTDDLWSDARREKIAHNSDWWTEKRGRDKATQCNGTLTKGKHNETALRDSAEVMEASLMSNSSNGNNKAMDFADSITNSNILRDRPVTPLEKRTSDNYIHPLDYASSSKQEVKPLQLDGKHLRFFHKTANNQPVLNMRTHYVSPTRNRIFENNANDHLTNHVRENREANTVQIPQMKGLFRLQRDEIDTKPKHSLKLRQGNYQQNGLFPLSEEKANATTNGILSTIGCVRGKKIPSDSHTTDEERNWKTERSYSRNADNFTSAKTDQKYRATSMEESSRARYSRSEKKRGFDTGSMIDWSLSGFRLRTRDDNRMSSSSDSECVIHRRPPLLMYIPGVSHHDKPAVDDDRLSVISSISKSEIDNDFSPLILSDSRTDFRRRNSMPRDSKLNWLNRRTSNKRSFFQT